MGSVCKNGFLRACEIQFSESRQEGVSHLNIALFSSVMRRGSSFEGLVWLSALFFVQRDARQSRSFIVEWRGMPSLFRSASAFGASIPEPTLTRRGGTTPGQTAFARLGCLARKYGRMCVSALRLAIINIKWLTLLYRACVRRWRVLLERFTAVVLTDDEGSGDCWVFVRPRTRNAFQWRRDFPCGDHAPPAKGCRARCQNQQEGVAGCHCVRAELHE
jgi:hypothetical protein